MLQWLINRHKYSCLSTKFSPRSVRYEEKAKIYIDKCCDTNITSQIDTKWCSIHARVKNDPSTKWLYLLKNNHKKISDVYFEGLKAYAKFQSLAKNYALFTQFYERIRHEG